jgi:hypothetical protein
MVDMSEDREDREAILKRRAIFVASALGSIGIAAAAAACKPEPCLDIAPPQGGAGGEGGACGGAGGTGGCEGGGQGGQ